MGILDQYNQTNINMKVFIALSTLLAVASAAPAQHSHQSIHKDGLAIHTVGHTAHGGHAAAHSVVAPIHHAGFHGHHAPHHAVHHAPHHLAHGVHDGLAHHAPHHAVHHGLAHHAPHHAVAHGVHHAHIFHHAPVHHAPLVHHAAPVHLAPAVVHHEQGPAAYNYGYAVADSYSGVNFGSTEARDGYATTGSYNVLLPDGRTQTVTYTVGDDYSGYVADVQYSGEPAPYVAAPAPH